MKNKTNTKPVGPWNVQTKITGCWRHNQGSQIQAALGWDTRRNCKSNFSKLLMDEGYLLNFPLLLDEGYLQINIQEV